MILPVLLNIISLILFIYACFVAASDAQGAIAFFFLLPLVFILLLVSAVQSQKKDLKRLRTLSISGLVFCGLFIVFSFIPGLGVMPATVIGGVSSIFEKITGKSPYAWTREKNDVIGKMNRDLKQKHFNMKNYDTSLDWEKVCFFGPHTQNNSAEKLLGFPWELSKYSGIANLDNITVVVFASAKKVSYFVEYPRSLADFTPMSGKCYLKNEAEFKEEPKNSKIFIHSK